ncbi:MAG: hypothetical protein HPY80_01070 [Bacteroidales bacterium]|jgi:hypothetical protein|nr:hypothetical protein [Bacteroidales bacterium]NPV35239.1 hypothetical protein [Bacteroidales bacterium]
MRKINVLLLVILAVSQILVSCSKDEGGDNGGPTQPNNPSGFNVPDGIGVLAAIKLTTITPIPGMGNYEVTTATGTAWFGTIGSSSGNDAGTVKLNNQALTWQSTGGVYIGNFQTSFPPVSWEVSGSASVPAFTKNITAPFPEFSGDLPENPTTSSDLTINLGGKVSNADSVIAVVAGNTAVMKVVSAGTNQVTFNKSQLGNLGTIRQISVNAVKYLPETIEGKKIWFILEGSKAQVYNVMP